ncbi:MAG: glycosyltransferase [Halioglobus sp.]|nr:glycosyltransferase [Halioglobus sp.]
MKQADDIKVTICITPRERFSSALTSLRNIIANTEFPYHLVYIDANSPAHIGQSIAATCAEYGFDYIRIDKYLSPNRARNRALSIANTPYVVFADNDLYADTGWLPPLIDCAEATGAWAVGPIILEGIAALRVIHMAGGDFTELELEDGSVKVAQRHRYMMSPLRSIQKKLQREPVGAFEFHCVLLRTSAFEQREFLNNNLLSHGEHLDLARDIRLAGGDVYFEPRSIVRYDTATPFHEMDREFFELRWSEEWCNRSLEEMRKKWGLRPDDESLQRMARWTAKHRQLFSQSQKSWLRTNLPVVGRRWLSTLLRERGLLRAQVPR